MEAPTRGDPSTIKDAQVNLFRAVAEADPAHYVRGQYEGYRAIEGVAKDSTTETFVALKLQLRNKRWRGVPFYLRHGKALSHKYGEIVITFKPASCKLFSGPTGKLAENKLVIRIQPDEGVKLQFNLKEQNADRSALPYTMDFSHEAEFGMNMIGATETDVCRSLTSWTIPTC